MTYAPDDELIQTCKAARLRRQDIARILGEPARTITARMTGFIPGFTTTERRLILDACERINRPDISSGALES